ncbi:MAG: GNAT family N-acetyltransferase [Clostridia bacterium]|nr:GNAT family N-acetyltransferase [Clostridia bacterium]
MVVSSINIREYREADWTRVEAIHDAARPMELKNAHLEAAFVPLKQAAVNEGLFEYEVRVAEIDGEVCGFVAYMEEELAWLYVDPAQMRRGVGRALVQYVLDHTRTRPLNIEVLAGNTPALKLYEAMGFHTVKVLSGKMPGKESFQVTVHCMQRAQ